MNEISKATTLPPEPDEQCAYEFAPGVRCMMVAGHEEPYYPYLDCGQWGKYSDILSEGSPHEVLTLAPALPPRDEWTGEERRKDLPSYPVFFSRKRPVD